MTLSIVTDSSSAPAILGVVKTKRWVCDVYRGTADALVAAGLIALPQLQPQNGRRARYTVFLPDGSPCPPTQRAWRDPGYKTIFQVNDGTCIVEVTVPKEMQGWRRKAEKAEKHEREQQRINEALAECGQQYRNWELKHEYSGGAIGGSWHASYEWWEGTKEQLQREDIGVGMAFPGEPGGPKELYCKCPLGFDVRVYLPDSSYAPGKAAARIYTAQSWYVPHVQGPKQFSQYAPGVLLEVWTLSGWRGRDSYYGSAEALIAAGLVPSLAFFPGQPGMNKMHATYRKDWTAATNSPRNVFGAAIHKRGKGNQFCLELAVSEAEEKRRDEVYKKHDKDTSERAKLLAAERKQLRQGVSPGKSDEEFRAKRAETAEALIDFLWLQVFAVVEGGLSLDIPKDGELWEDLGEAFQTIRDAVQEADIVRDKKQAMAAQARLKLVAARNDKGLQSMLQSAKGLRLVHSAGGNAQE